MPELPEVETMIRGLRPAVEGRTLQRVRRCRCACRPITVEPSFPTIGRRVRGTRIERVRRLAKRAVFHLSSGDALVVEPRMTGLLLLADPPDPEHLRIEFRLAGDEPSAFWFWDRRGLGTFRLYSPSRFERDFGPHGLGPDALEISFEEWRTRCRGTKRAIKVALLDQRFVAGIGNLYASEILFRAGIRPTTRTNRLSARRVRRLADSTREVLEQAIRYEGSTLADGTYRNALNQDGGYQNQHRVYARDGEPCPQCGAEIRRIVQAQRSTFYCPACQR